MILLAAQGSYPVVDDGTNDNGQIPYVVVN